MLYNKRLQKKVFFLASKRAIRLKTLGDCCRELGRLYNRLNREEIKLSQARCQVYTLNSLIQALKDSELEKRVQELEERFEHES